MAHQQLVTHVRSGSGGMKQEAVRVRLMGGFEVSVGSWTIHESRWRLRKAGSLIKLLALAQGHRLHREQVMDLLWPDLDTKSAANNLHHVLHFARKALRHDPVDTGSGYLRLEGDQLVLWSDGTLWVDVEAFENAAATARHSRQPAAYRAAIDLYAGDLLPEMRYEHWAEERRWALRTMYLALLIELGGLYEAQGEPDPAIEVLQKVVATERIHEEAHSMLMRLYAISGERQRALLQYGRLQKALSEDLETEPSVEVVRLHEEILAGRFPRARSGSPPPEKPQGAAGEHNLPNLPSSFVGREREIVDLKRSLAMTRLLTRDRPMFRPQI